MASETGALDDALARASAGDEAGFLQLWRALQPPLLRFLRVIGCDDPDDVASETWLQVVRDLPRFSGAEEDFRRWLFTIGRHRAIDAARARSLSWTFQPMTGGGMVVLLEDITERRTAEARISHLARYDALTALPNRLNFRDEIGRLLAVAHHADRLSALLFVDLDQFKQVNDTLGHPCGDQLLCAVAERLRDMLRPEDFVARFGGDEFVVFQQDIKSNEDAAVLARRIVDRLSERYKIDNHLVEIGASVGIAMTSPHGTSADTLLKNADMALYGAKADGRGTYRFFESDMDARMKARRDLEMDLRKAVVNKEFELYYQPLVNLQTNNITAFEALLLWKHPRS